MKRFFSSRLCRTMALTVIIFCNSTLLLDSASAQVPQANFGIIEQTITVPFKPVSVYALLENKLGEIQQFRGVASPLEAETPAQTNADDSSLRPVAVAAIVPVNAEATSTEKFHFTFFLASLNGEFAATEVGSWSWQQLRENSLPLEALKVRIEKLSREVDRQRDQNSSLENELITMRNEASKIAGVDDIIDLKTELDNLKGFDEKKNFELERLRTLYKNGLVAPESPNAAELRLNLGQQLVNAARITAVTDRQSNTKRENIVASYRRKVELVKETQNLDPEELAQEALAVRKRRRELEQQLNLNSDTTQAPEQEF